MKSEILIAIDPGKISGYVVLDITNPTNLVVLTSDELNQFATCLRLDEDLLDNVANNVHVVCESFKITPETGKKNDVNYSLEIIGVVKYLCKLRNVRMTLQTPADAKSFVDNDRLRAMNLWVPGGAGHAKDAMRHACFYAVTRLGMTSLAGLLS